MYNDEYLNKFNSKDNSYDSQSSHHKKQKGKPTKNSSDYSANESLLDSEHNSDQDGDYFVLKKRPYNKKRFRKNSNKQTRPKKRVGYGKKTMEEFTQKCFRDLKKELLEKKMNN